MAALALSRSPTPPPTMSLPSSQPAATPDSTPTLPIPGTDSDRATPIQIPNKHMPQPNPGGIMFTTSPVTPPASPPNGSPPPVADLKKCMESRLYPPDDFPCLQKSPPIYSISPSGLADAVNFTARQPLPDIDELFPWAHGLHPDNLVQIGFFFARKSAVRSTPTCYRGLCIVKAGRDIHKARLKGAITPEEILPLNPHTPGFLCVDPREGFNVRNFQIQVGKFAALSDIVVYGGEDTDPNEVARVAKQVSLAQMHHRSLCLGNGIHDFPVYNTFIVDKSFSEFETLFPEMVAVDSNGFFTGKVVEFCQWERMEMCNMSRASEITNNVWLGTNVDRLDDTRGNQKWGVLIEAVDLAAMPTVETLSDVEAFYGVDTLQIEFPGSGTISPSNWTKIDVDGVIGTCQWIYELANGVHADEKAQDSDGDHRMTPAQQQPRKVLIYCTDGYTETSLLGLAYLMFAEVLPVHEAWIKMHTEKKRNFFAYDKDLSFLRYIEHRLLEAAIRNRNNQMEHPKFNAPEWLYRMDGSLPSRVLPYMYLGNLLHANNCGMLRAVGIKRVLSIGEEVSWSQEERKAFGEDNVMTLRDLQDNGCDPLTAQFKRCLNFIDQAHLLNEPVLVHCRVGVSRSATICIAEVMKSLKISLPRAYCYVRARRLNVIIQPHLRFMFELLKFEETLLTNTGSKPKRELEWMHVAREVAAMNRPYTRQ